MTTVVGGFNTSLVDHEKQVIRIQCLARGWLARRLCAVLAHDLYQLCYDEASKQAYYLNARTSRVHWSSPVLLDHDKHTDLVDNLGTAVHSKTEVPKMSSAPGQGPIEDVVHNSATFDRSAGEAFLALCTEEKRSLYETHRRAVMHSVRRWERRQLREKTDARADRLAKTRSDNSRRLGDLEKGSKTYNLKSIRQAAVHGDINRLVELLDQGFNADSPSAMGLTPLLGASQSSCLEAIKVLLQRGADVNHQHVKTKRTALMEASSRESPEVVRELLRYGARLDVQDAHGETAYDCARDPHIHRWLRLASSIWSLESAEVFPNSFRAAARTLLLVQKRQNAEDVERRSLSRRELVAIRPAILRSAAESKMCYDEQVRISHAQVTLLRKVDVLHQADEQFDRDRTQLLQLIETALLSKAEAEQTRTLPDASITIILSFCGRYWFDSQQRCHKKKQRRCNRSKATSIEPTDRRVGRETVFEAIKTEWTELQHSLEGHCDELRRIQNEEYADPDNGVTRNKDGQTLSSLHVCVIEGQHLPYRDPRIHEPIDPLIRLLLRVRGENYMSLSTESRLSDRHPMWNKEFTFSVESTKVDLVVQLIDAKRKETAGEVTVSLRTLLDQKQHEEWLILPPTLRQQALEKTPREYPARVHLTLHLVHTPSVLLTRAIQQLLAVRSDVLQRKITLMQEELENYIRKLTA